jgi:hypothetical protein
MKLKEKRWELQKLSEELQWPSPPTRRCASLPAAHDPEKMKLFKQAASNPSPRVS